MTFILIENVRGYLGSRPPLVAFMIVLAAMAVGLITFAYFVSDMPRAVVDQEYGRFIDHLNGVNICVGGGGGSGGDDPRGSGSGSVAAPPPPTAQVSVMSAERGLRREPREVDMSASSSSSSSSGMTAPPSPPASTALSSLSPSNLVVNVCLAVTVEVPATAVFQGLAGTFNSTVVTSTLTARQLGRQGYGMQDAEANVSLVLPPLGNRSHPCLQGHKGALCYMVSGCLTLTAPRHFFPHAQRLDVPAETCQRGGDSELLWGENHMHGDASTLEMLARCAHNGSLLHIQHVLNTDHNSGVFIPDSSDVNLHLMHSSYFLFVMVISLFCYALIKGRPSKMKVIHVQASGDKHALIQA